MAEFIVTIPEGLPQSINANFEELRGYLNENLAKYNSMVVTADGIADAKKSKAALNKLKTAVEDRRKDIKREWNKPYDEFEGKVKALVSLIDVPIASIDRQIKVFDEQRIEDKRVALIACYTAAIDDYSDILPFEKFLDPKWKNVTADLDKLKEEMQAKISKCKSDLKIISATCGQYTAACQQRYIETLNVSDALAEFKRLEELDRRRAIIEAEEKKKTEEKAKAVEVEPPPIPQEAPLPIMNTQPATEELKTIDVRFHNTTAAFRADMKALCIKHGIQYGNVPKGV